MPGLNQIPKLILLIVIAFQPSVRSQLSYTSVSNTTQTCTTYPSTSTASVPNSAYCPAVCQAYNSSSSNGQSCVGTSYSTLSNGTVICVLQLSPPAGSSGYSSCTYSNYQAASSTCISTANGQTQTTQYPVVQQQSCSFPFTYAGQLYYSCKQNVTNVTLCGQSACLLVNRTWAICATSQTTYVAQNYTVTVQIPNYPNNPQTTNSVNNWLTIMQRLHVSASFNQSWSSYVSGFGTYDGDYWMGLENMYQLLSNGTSWKIRFEMCFTGALWMSAEFYNVQLSSSATNYILTVSGYSGDSGDAFSTSGTAAYIQSGQMFSTYDKNNQKSKSSNCAKTYGAGWWFQACTAALFTGSSQTSFCWYGVPSKPTLTMARIMISPR